jgi:hypothetical protein
VNARSMDDSSAVESSATSRVETKYIRISV